jgi:hypothetical protein
MRMRAVYRAANSHGMLLPMSLLLAEAPRALLLFLYALLFALVEIEIEGGDGWAEKLPTWYRVRPWYARILAIALSGKPVTGYHLTMLPLSVVSFHLGYLFGQPWSKTGEARVLAAYMVFNVIWDFLWFVLNPHFGWSRFRKGGVWWHGKVWLGRFPIDYWNGIALSFIFAALPWLFGRGRALLDQHAILALEMVALTALAAALAPLYQRWYRHMRRPESDERKLVLRR